MSKERCLHGVAVGREDPLDALIVADRVQLHRVVCIEQHQALLPVARLCAT